MYIIKINEQLFNINFTYNNYKNNPYNNSNNPFLTAHTLSGQYYVV